ncbi:hypothetical protein BKA62DRAFT_435945 [Auriculariales sp. MPI-PUGE-AT-0066]|nr:hypothetical protein BKA62DRAFT_435945 [Auriculariales sp. MPI-PUGE-AT-0066]
MAVDNQSYKVTLEATDPAIRFGEYVDYPQCNCGWTTTFAGGVAPATFGQQPGEMGVGKGTRAATKVGSFAEFEFYGSSVSVYGWIRGDVVVSPTLGPFVAYAEYKPVEGLKNGTDGLIFELTGLQVGWHAFMLNITKEGTGDAQLGLDHVVYTTGLPARMQKTTTYLPDDNIWDLKGQWSRNDIPDVSNPGQNLRTLVTTEYNATANINITGLSLLYLYGDVHWGARRFQVFTWDPKSNQTYLFLRQGWSNYARENVVLWWTIIPDKAMYRISLINSDWDKNATPANYELGLTRLEVYQLGDGSVSSTDSSTSTGSTATNSATSTPDTIVAAHKGPPVGAIAGGTVGGLLALALAILGIILLCRRRRKVTPVFDGVDADPYMRPVAVPTASPSSLVLSNEYPAFNPAYSGGKGSRAQSAAPTSSGGSAVHGMTTSSTGHPVTETTDAHGWQLPPRYREPVAPTVPMV